MDKYLAIRNIPFPGLAHLLEIDLQRFKQRKEEYQGYCPIHQSKENNNCFSYNNDTGAFHCFSCNAKGKGSIDLVMQVKGCKFTEAWQPDAAFGHTPTLLQGGLVALAWPLGRTST